MCFRLGERQLLEDVYLNITVTDVPSLVHNMSAFYLPRLLAFLASMIETNPHVEFHLTWLSNVLEHHGMHLAKNKANYSSVMKDLLRILTHKNDAMIKLVDSNRNTLNYILACAQS